MERLHKLIPIPAVIVFCISMAVQVSGFQSVYLAYLLYGLTGILVLVYVWPWVRRIRIGLAPPDKELQEAKRAQQTILEQVDETREKIRAVNAANQELEAKISSLEKHKSDLQKLFDDANRRLGVLQRDLDQATKDRSLLQHENSTLRERVQRLDEDLKNASAYLDVSEADKKHLASSLQEADSYGANLQKALDATKKERISVKRQLTKTKSQLTKTEAELDKARKDREKAEKRHKDFLASLPRPERGYASTTVLNPSPMTPRLSTVDDETVSPRLARLLKEKRSSKDRKGDDPPDFKPV